MNLEMNLNTKANGGKELMFGLSDYNNARYYRKTELLFEFDSNSDCIVC